MDALLIASQVLLWLISASLIVLVVGLLRLADNLNRRMDEQLPARVPIPGSQIVDRIVVGLTGEQSSLRRCGVVEGCCCSS
jgi:hypothetical protein